MAKNRKTSGMADKAISLPFLFLIGGLFYAFSTLAQPSGPNSINQVSSQRGNVSNAAQQVNAQAGNVTELNIDAITITQAWQGYYGNITGNIVLTDANDNTFYNWSGLGSLSGEIYASRDNNVDWGTVNCSNSSVRSSEESFLGKQVSDPDSVNNTFNNTSHPEFLVGTETIATNTCRSTNAFSSSGQDSSRFYQVLLQDGGGDMIYTTIIDENQAGFNGANYDFELLVGENGNSTSQGTTPYYFYIELS